MLVQKIKIKIQNQSRQTCQTNAGLPASARICVSTPNCEKFMLSVLYVRKTHMHKNAKRGDHWRISRGSLGHFCSLSPVCTVSCPLSTMLPQRFCAFRHPLILVLVFFFWQDQSASDCSTENGILIRILLLLVSPPWGISAWLVKHALPKTPSYFEACRTVTSPKSEKCLSHTHVLFEETVRVLWVLVTLINAAFSRLEFV